MRLFKKGGAEPDEMERHQERQASATTYSILSKLLLAWWTIELVGSFVRGGWDHYNHTPFLLYVLMESVHQVSQLYYKSKTGDEDAAKELGKTLAVWVGVILFLIWLCGSALDIILRT